MSEAPLANGFRIRGLNPDSDRVSVQSSVQDTWMLTYKKWKLLRQWFDVGLTRDELTVIKCQGGEAIIEIEPQGDTAGTLIAASSRYATKTMRVGQRYRFEIERGEALVLRSPHIRYPTHAGAGLTV